MDIVITTNEQGIPGVQVSSVLDWLDLQIAAAQDAKKTAGEGAVIFLDHAIASYGSLKKELVAATMEIMDVRSGS